MSFCHSYNSKEGHYMEKILISIVVPVYCVEKYLRACLDSLRMQTHKRLQIILIDDGSTDGSGSICDDYALHDDRIQVLHQKNHGVAFSRNLGVQIAQGEYILFVDADDTISENACSEFLSKAQNTGAEVVAGDSCWLDESAEQWETQSVREVRHTVESGCLGGQEYFLDQLKHDTYIDSVCVYFYKRTFLQQSALRFVSGIIREDAEWLPRMFLSARKVAQINKIFYYYHMHDGSIMRNHDNPILSAYDFMRHVCLSGVEVSQSYKPELQRIYMVYLVRRYLGEVVLHITYFTNHKDEIDYDFLQKYAYDKKVGFWISLSKVNLRAFYCLWKLREKWHNIF